MVINIVEKYIDLTRKMINSYMRLVMANKFNRGYNDIFTEKYIRLRYCNDNENSDLRTIRGRIMEGLKNTEDNLVIVNIRDRELIQNMCLMFYYVLHFDNVAKYDDLDKIISRIAKLRKRVLKKQTKDFEKNLKEIIIQCNQKKEELLNITENSKFYLNIKRYPNKINIFRVSIRYNIKFPEEYSEIGIEKIYNTGIVNEDKLFLEYYFISEEILKDIIDNNFKKQYIVEFAVSVISKKQKCKSLFSIIDSAAIKDKISLKIQYEDFLENKDNVYELLRDGYHIAVILDNSFNADYKNIESLKMFQYVIVDKESSTYDKVKEYKNYIENLIEI